MFSRDGEYTILDKKIYYLKSAVKSKSLLVILNTHNQGDRYFCLKRIREITYKCSDIIFITNPDNNYYGISKVKNSDFYILLSKIFSNYVDDEITLFGSSMAGYAALYFSMKFNTNVILNNPQLDLEVSKKNAWPNLMKTLNSLPETPKLNSMLTKYKLKRNCVIYYGQHPLDITNIEPFLGCFNEAYCQVSVKKMDSLKHDFYFKNVNEIIYQHYLILFALKNCRSESEGLMFD